MFVSFAGIASVQVETVGRNESCACTYMKTTRCSQREGTQASIAERHNKYNKRTGHNIAKIGAICFAPTTPKYALGQEMGHLTLISLVPARLYSLQKLFTRRP